MEPAGDVLRRVTYSPEGLVKVLEGVGEELASQRFAVEPAPAPSLQPDLRYDLPALLELARRGCPPDLAVRILAPLTEDRR